ncbi:MAG: hypothetical protein NTZ73_00400 [Candidatus Diapherotrites archaeon]|nr:hypothetical protein [Candidatus Diapherotrites archaeon]
MEATTIKLYSGTKMELDSFREYKNESYDEVVRKLLFIAKNCSKKPELSKQTVEDIERARRRIKEGKYLTEAEARKVLRL